MSFIDNPDIQGDLLWHFIRVSAGSRQYLRPTGAFTGCFVTTETVDYVMSTIDTTFELGKKFMEDGLIVDTVSENCFCHFHEYGHFEHVEQAVMYDPIDSGSITAAEKLRAAANRVGLQKWGALGRYSGDRAHDVMGPQVYNYHLWLRKIKKAFDPSIVSDSSFYITPKQ